MAIANKVASIRNAIYGRDVREAIAGGIEECYSDVSNGVTLVDEVVQSANAAASNANSKATLADTAASSANEAASNANTKATLANTAAETANAAAEMANSAAATANMAASNADSKASSANTAASNADSKATLANTAAATANNAADNADTKAALANTAASNADSKATLANTAADRANSAAEALEGMTVSNSIGDTSDADVTMVDGHYHISFTTEKGERGSRNFTGQAITGVSTTPTSYDTGIASAVIGDRYYYNGTSSNNVGNVYVCTEGGNQTNAKWVYDSNIRGVPGSGSVSFVDSVAPDSDGNVNLGAVRSVDGIEPNSDGELALGAVRSVDGIEPNSDGELALGAVRSVDGIEPNSGGELALGAVKNADLATSIINLIYPVGSIYMSVNSADPSVFIGGTWVPIHDTFLWCAGSNHPAGTDGGEETVSLSIAEMPPHNHNSVSLTGTINVNNMPIRYKNSSNATLINGTGIFSANTTSRSPDKYYIESSAKLDTWEGRDTLNIDASHTHRSEGSGNAHNNMPPYLSVYVWKRTA